MGKCPKCGTEVEKSEKEWTYRIFNVEVFACQNCGAKFRNYSQKGKLAFVLVHDTKGGNYHKP